MLWIFGWDIKGKPPDHKKYILIGGPHTSNWDFPIGIAAIYTFRLRISWIGKHTLFHWSYGWFFRWLGGVPVDRDSPQGIVDQMADKLRSSEELVLVLAPAGTRRKRDYWKSGFYRIAMNAEVPLACVYLDFSEKIACIGPPFMLTGDVHKDMNHIREFFEGHMGKYPDLMTPVRLRDE